MSKDYPIYFNETQRKEILYLLESVREIAKAEGQGTCSLLHILYTQIREINPKIKSVSCNYYDCAGRKAFAIKVAGSFTDLIKFDGDVVKGWVFGAPNGHLSKYFKLSW